MISPLSVECCILGNTGIRAKWKMGDRFDSELFSEEQSRIVVSLEPSRMRDLEKMAARHRVPIHKLGTVGGDRFIIENLIDLPLDEIIDAWKGGLARAMA